VSRSLHPKQLLPIVGDRSMLQATIGRFAAPGFATSIVVGGEEHRFLIADQLAEVAATPGAIILEPSGRNTAAAIALAAHHALAGDPAAMLLVVPSDHVIADPDAFRRAITTGAVAAADGALITFGITPTGPETGYGYIEAGAPLVGAPGVEHVARFVEKPDAATAAAFAISPSSRSMHQQSPPRAPMRWRRRQPTAISFAPNARHSSPVPTCRSTMP